MRNQKLENSRPRGRNTFLYMFAHAPVPLQVWAIILQAKIPVIAWFSRDTITVLDKRSMLSPAPAGEKSGELWRVLQS